MNPRFKKFLTTNLLAALVMASIAGLLYATVLKTSFHWLVPLILLSCLLINLLAFKVFTGQEKPELNIVRAIMRSFFVKFVSYTGLALLIILALKSKTVMVPSLVLLLSAYLIFSILEVRALTEFAKNKES